MTFQRLILIRFCLGLFLLAGILPTYGDTPNYSHVVVVMLENHSYQELDSDSSLTFINDTLRSGGADMFSYGVQHPSQDNYDWIFSGSNQGILSDDPVYYPGGSLAATPQSLYTTVSGTTTGVFTSPNLYTSLSSAGKTFAGYVDAYPGAGNSLYSDNGNYARRHVPWLGWSSSVVPASVSQNFAASPLTTGIVNPANFNSLPTVSFVIPGLNNDMHDGNNGSPVANVTESNQAMANSDAWLAANLSAYAAWAKANNSLLILTTDEDSTADWPDPSNNIQNIDGYTAPNLGPNNSAGNHPSDPPSMLENSGPNQITTIFYGANVIPGFYDETGLNGNSPGVSGITNINVLETILSFYGQPGIGAQPSLISAYGIGDGAITDIFGAVPEPSSYGWMAAGLLLLGMATRRAKRV